jgi:hypothetical protein
MLYDDIKRIYVCGPPLMNEIMDINLGAIKKARKNNQVADQSILGGEVIIDIM